MFPTTRRAASACRARRERVHRDPHRDPHLASTGMSGALLVRLGLLAAGLLAFGVGVRTNNEVMRWAGIGCIGAALVARLAARFTQRR